MTQLSKVRKRLLKERGVQLAKLTRKPVPIEELPSAFPKTTLMRLIEMKFKERLENLIFNGTIYVVGKRLGVNQTTISKWRKLVNESKRKEFFSQFK